MRGDTSRSLRLLAVIGISAVIFDTAALIAYSNAGFNWLLLPLAAFAVWYSIARDERALLLVPLAELMWGSFGASLQWQIGGFRLPLRILIFGICVLYWAVQRSKGRLTPVRSFTRDALQYVLLAAPACWAFAWGLFRGNGAAAVFFDGNAYLYLLYIPLWHLVYDQKMVRLLRSLILGIALALSVKTLILMNIFTNQYEGLNVQYLYLWLRDTRVGEITATGTAIWRIFMQSQLYIGIALVHVAIESIAARKLTFVHAACTAVLGAGILASMSRSYWLGLVATGAIIAMVVLVTRVMHFSELVQFVLRYFGALAAAAALVVLLVFIPGGGKDLGGTLAGRLAVDDAAGSSRAQLLGPLWTAVREHPWIGQGFGATVTYRSNDPRIKNPLNPEGVVTTAAFEWGYLDQWLKWGIIGMLLWAFVILRQFLRGFRIMQGASEERLWVASMLAGLVFILCVHVVSPYLNHPLGIGYVLLTMLVLQHSVQKYHA